MDNTISNIVSKTIKTLPVEITQGEAELFNSLPANEVVSALDYLIHSESNPSVVSRAFDALLKIESFDRVSYLINLADNYPDKWGLICYQSLSNFQDNRAIKKLCDVAQNDKDPNIRFVAIESLGKIGNESIIPVLKHIKTHDNGVDFEGIPVATIANHTIEKIRQKSLFGSE